MTKSVVRRGPGAYRRRLEERQHARIEADRWFYTFTDRRSSDGRPVIVTYRKRRRITELEGA